MLSVNPPPAVTPFGNDDEDEVVSLRRSYSLQNIADMDQAKNVAGMGSLAIIYEMERERSLNRKLKRNLHTPELPMSDVKELNIVPIHPNEHGDSTYCATTSAEYTDDGGHIYDFPGSSTRVPHVDTDRCPSYDDCESAYQFPPTPQNIYGDMRHNLLNSSFMSLDGSPVPLSVYGQPCSPYPLYMSPIPHLSPGRASVCDSRNDTFVSIPPHNNSIDSSFGMCPPNIPNYVWNPLKGIWEVWPGPVSGHLYGRNSLNNSHEFSTLHAPLTTTPLVLKRGVSDYGSEGNASESGVVESSQSSDGCQRPIVEDRSKLSRLKFSFVPSVGSIGHSCGKCYPCAFFASAKGCSKGVDCMYCHLCNSAELSRRRKLKEIEYSKLSEVNPDFAVRLRSGAYDSEYKEFPGAPHPYGTSLLLESQ